MNKLIFSALGGMLLSGVAMLFLNKPTCPACPACPDCAPKLQVQPFNLDAEQLQKIKRSSIHIEYHPTYTGEIIMQECDTISQGGS
ncbi:MAG: hypothetical protein AAFY71_07890 [Bacteroidota bacterium]